MKLVFENRNMRQLAGFTALALGLLFAPTAQADNGAVQKLPSPEQTEHQQKAQEFTRTIKKEFPISSTGEVNLSNKYGKVNVQTWERDRVKIDVTIVVEANSESAAQKVFDRINIEFANDDKFVKAETSIESTKGWWDGWGDNNRTEFQVNYEVFMPESCDLDLSNKYGDATVSPIDGSANVSVKYGDFQLEGVGGELVVYLGYGNGTVVKARDVSAEVSYSKLNLNDVQDVNFNTKYSKLYVDKGVTVKAESKYDHFSLAEVDRFNCQAKYGNVEIGDIESLVAVSQYTDYRVDRLSDNADLDLKYGGLRIDELAKGFSEVNLNGKYSDFKIYVEEGASFMLDAETDYAGISYPTGLNVAYEKDKGTSHEVKGHSGTQGARSVIKATLEYGGLKVKQ